MYAYFMAAICAVSGLLLIFKMGREKKLYYPLGTFLLLLGGWVLADELTAGALSGSWAIWVQRAVLLVVIVVLFVIMRKDIRASKAAAENEESKDEFENENAPYEEENDEADQDK